MGEASRFSERLKHALINAGYEPRPSVLEREFNLRYWGPSISFQATRRWLNGETIPMQDRLQVLAEWLNVDPHWLRFGERLNRAEPPRSAAKVLRQLTPEEENAIRDFLALPEDKRRIFQELFKACK
jgi:transcriptional regulator with XRE-family HTH domain